MSERLLIPFENTMGQVINVGDPILVISESYKTTSIRKGVYVGMHGNKVQAEVPAFLYKYCLGDTDEECRWNHPDAKRHQIVGSRIATLQRNRIFKFVE